MMGPLCRRILLIHVRACPALLFVFQAKSLQPLNGQLLHFSQIKKEKDTSAQKAGVLWGFCKLVQVMTVRG